VISRVMNVAEINPKINHYNLCEEIKKEFLNFYSPKKINEERLDYKVLEKNEKINEIYQELSSHEWNYMKTPEFTNELETRFNWGTLNFFVKVQKGYSFIYITLFIFLRSYKRGSFIQ